MNRIDINGTATWLSRRADCFLALPPLPAPVVRIRSFAYQFPPPFHFIFSSADRRIGLQVALSYSHARDFLDP